MSGVIGDLIDGVVGYFTDLWVLRRQRAHRGRPANAWRTDAGDVAVLDGWTLVVSLLAVIACVVLYAVFALPVWLSVLLPVAPTVLYFVYRWRKLLRA